MSEIVEEYKRIIALNMERCQLEKRLEEINSNIEKDSFYWEIDEEGLVQRVSSQLY